MKYILNDIIVATLNFLGVAMDLWIHRRTSVFFWSCMLKHSEVICHDVCNFSVLQKESKTSGWVGSKD